MKRFITGCLIAVVLAIPVVTVKWFQSNASFPEKAAAQSTDANFKVAFIGDSGAATEFQNVLNLIKAENAQLVLHQGDLDYSDGPTKWMGMVNATLGSNFPYLASDGNHDEWDADGYAAFFKDRLTKMGLSAPSGNLSSSYAVTYKGLRIVFSKENGDPTFIDTQLKSATQTWKICSWHKNMKLMQIGGKGDEQGWPDYETCRKYGAIIATGHEHSYERTKTLSNTQTQTIDATCSDPKNVCVAPGKTFVFVSGLAGSGIRNQDLCLPSSPPYGCNGIWASIYTSDQGAKEGALFVIFNYNGNPNKAHAYFKNISGQIIDEFDITATSGTVPTGPQPTGTRPPTGPQPTSGPLPTLPPGTTGVIFRVFLHGIGKGGDNVNANSTGTLNPTRTQRPVTLTLTNANNITLPTVSGTIRYDAASGSFVGAIPLPSNTQSGPYIIKIKTDQYLGGTFTGIQQITAGQGKQLTDIRLVAGDANLDNRINNDDHAVILECYSDILPAKNCADAAKKLRADISDDGNVNQFDLNLLLRELSVQTGN